MKLQNLDGTTRPLLILPQKTIEQRCVPLDPADRVAYDRLFGFVKERVTAMSDHGPHFAQVLVLLTRLRQLACSSALVPKEFLDVLQSSDSTAERVLKKAMLDLGEGEVQKLIQNLEAAAADDCCVCLCPGVDVVTRCGHVFHRKCIEVALKDSTSNSCPLCRQKVNPAELIERPEALELEVSQDSLASAAPSGKLRDLLEFLKTLQGCSDQFIRKPHKAVVFSQFTSLLDLLQAELGRQGLAFVRVDGKMAQDKRAEALETFRDHPHVQVLICSLRAGGVGLNLTMANHVILIDPWWNPSVEDQAMDRVHRLGQQRPVRCIRFVSERTVEDRIIALHSQKRLLMEGALGGKSREELRKMRFDMISSLFSDE